MPNLKEEIEELKRLYLDEGMSYAEIGRKFGCTKQNIGKLLKRAGIKARDRRGLWRPAIDRDTLRKLYVQDRLLIVEIARQTGLKSHTVSKYLDLYRIPKRSDRFKDCYPKIQKLETGQSFETPRLGSKSFYNRFYEMAKRAGIQVSIKRVPNDMLRISRVK